MAVTDIRLSRYISIPPWSASISAAHPSAVTFVTADGVQLDAVHIDSQPGRELTIVVVPGFTRSWRLCAMRLVTRTCPGAYSSGSGRYPGRR